MQIKIKKLIWWGATLAILLAGTIWSNRLSQTPSPAQSHDSANSAANDRSVSKDREARRESTKRAERNATREGFVKWQMQFEKPRITLDQIDQYLASEGRSSSALIFSLILYPREEVVQELRTRASDPIACLFLASGAVGVERLKWADNLITSDPNNSLGYLLKASALSEAGRPPAAAEQLALALELGNLNSYDKEINSHFDDIKGIAPANSAAIDHLNKSEVWLQKALGPTLKSDIFDTGSSDANVRNFESIFDIYRKFNNSKLDVSLAIAGRKALKKVSQDQHFSTTGAFTSFQRKVDSLNKEAAAEIDARGKYLKALSDHGGDDLDRFATEVENQGWPETSELEDLRRQIQR